ncbi:hypothetical protein [Saccharothrix australiensis]|uniref:Uncharacterized protein n=1 Tax=Saccharothrix australiensis TaxID=2072 RepID=A0A495W8M4_9PSEU|nr:hypothetical protein [Saccharothrix australiensis]RKT57497.1 hypothetical protein C8E97_6219 [Saccharothrix australiensis]
MAVHLVHVGSDTPITAHTDRDSETVLVAVGHAPDQVLLSLTETAAHRLVADVSREVEPCDDCGGTGERWSPMGVGAVRLSGCHCRAAAAKR